MTIFSGWKNQLQKWEYMLGTNQRWNALVMIFYKSIYCAISANFLLPFFKECHAALFWTKVFVVHVGNHPHKLLVLSIED